MDRATLKSNAKASLKGKYGDAILMFIVYGLITGFSGGVIGSIYGAAGGDSETIQVIGDIIGFVISCLLLLGIHSYFLKISRNETVKWDELFSKTKFFVPVMLITLLVSIFVGLWALLFIIPGIIAAISYSQVYFVKLDNPDMEVMDVLRKSKEFIFE